MNALRLGLTAAVLAGALAIACGGDGATKYQVTVHFNTAVTQADMDSVTEYLRGYDKDVDFLAQEIFPPIGVATLKTDAKDFCATVEEELESRSYISSVDCHKASEAPVTSPDAPASNEPDATNAR